MSTSKRLASLAVVLIALLVLQTAATSWLGLQLAVPAANAAPKKTVAPTATTKSPPCDDQECSNLLTPAKISPGPLATRIRRGLPFSDTLPGLTINQGPTPTPTRSRRVDTSKILVTPGLIALPCEDRSKLVSIEPAQPLATESLPFQVTVNMQNTGNCTWGTDWALKWIEKDRIGATPLSVSPTTNVAAGGTYPFVLHFLAPDRAGYYVTHWMLRGPASAGPLVEIVVYVGPPVFQGS